MGRAVRLNGYQFPEAPPSYASAVTLPRPSVPLTVLAPSSTSQTTVFGEPPPPYASLAQISENSTATIARRSILSSVVNALATIRRHRSSRSLPSGSTAQSQIQQENVISPAEAAVVSTANDSRVGRELLWRHSSATSDYHDYFTDDGSGGSTSLSASRDSLNSSSTAASSSSCCCSQCDSGLSRDDVGSLSSNDVRPRSEMSMIRMRQPSVAVDSIFASVPPTGHNVTEEPQNVVNNQRHQRLCESCQTALTATLHETPTNDVQASSSNGEVPTSSVTHENDQKKLKKRNLCKRKLKKLISRRRKKKNNADTNASHAHPRCPRRPDGDGDDETNDIHRPSTSNRNERMTSL